MYGTWRPIFRFQLSHICARIYLRLAPKSTAVRWGSEMVRKPSRVRDVDISVALSLYQLKLEIENLSTKLAKEQYGVLNKTSWLLLHSIFQNIF